MYVLASRSEVYHGQAIPKGTSAGNDEPALRLAQADSDREDEAMTMNPADFRAAMSHHPTAVCVITTTTSEGKAVGMTVGTFTSVSLDPPLVGFFPDKKSTSWPRIAQTGRFCVNLLADNQEDVCRTFAGRGPDKFADVVHRFSEHGLPLVDGAVAYIECSIHSVAEAGDHYLVLGEVDAMTVGTSASPLIFHKGTYAQVAPTARQVA